jgi:hypothetical protein
MRAAQQALAAEQQAIWTTPGTNGTANCQSFSRQQRPRQSGITRVSNKGSAAIWVQLRSGDRGPKAQKEARKATGWRCKAVGAAGIQQIRGLLP